jgi:drug/metabolite transporter (DMT)-like permease
MGEVPDCARERLGTLLGFIGVVGLSLVLPTTRLSVGSFGPNVVGIGRGALAGLAALAYLTVRREPFPRRHLVSLLLVALGVVIGFPWLTAWAMLRVPSSHGAVLLALLPIASAAMGRWRSHERPTWWFWLSSAIASLVVLLYAVSQGGGHLVSGDVALLGAVLLSAFSYAEGARLAHELGGTKVILWALVAVLPLTLPLALLFFLLRPVAAPSTAATLSFLYVSLGAQLLVYVLWYEGMRLTGVARTSQLQYLQPFLTFLWSALWLGERISLPTVGAALLTLAAVAVGRLSPMSLRTGALAEGEEP